MSKPPRKHYRAIIIGGGPAGTGVFVYASNNRVLKKLLNSGIAMVERGGTIGGGALKKYIINSNSLGGAFLECLEGEENGILAPAIFTKEKKSLSRFEKSPAPLKTVGEFLDVVGDCIKKEIYKSPKSDVLLSTEALSIKVEGRGFAKVSVRSLKDGKRSEITADKVIMALGGYHDLPDILEKPITRMVKIGQKNVDKVVLTDTLLTGDGIKDVVSRFEEIKRPKILILGGSHSALSAAWVFLNKIPQMSKKLSSSSIKVLHFNNVKLQYNSIDEAKRDGYAFSTANDVCSITGKVNRLGGLYGDAKELYKSVVGINGSENQEQRIKLLKISRDDNKLVQGLIDESNLIVPAFGYTTRSIPVVNRYGKEIELLFDRYGLVVDRRARVMRKSGRPISNIFAIGLGSGIKPTREIGGEKSFRGRSDGVWLYQHPIGEMIFREIVGS